MQDKCKFSHRGHELGTRIASVETAACVRLVANQHRAESSRQRATSSIPGKVIGRACQAAEQERENRLQLCTGLAWPGLGCAAYRSCFIPSSLVRLCVVYLDEWLGSPWQINSHSAIRHELARTVQNGVPSPEFHLIRGRVRTSRLGIRLWMGFTTSLKGTCRRPRHDSGSGSRSRSTTKGAKAAQTRLLLLQWKWVCVCKGGVGAGEVREQASGRWRSSEQRNKQKSIIVLRVFPLLLRIFYLDFERCCCIFFFFFNSFNL